MLFKQSFLHKLFFRLPLFLLLSDTLEPVWLNSKTSGCDLGLRLPMSVYQHRKEIRGNVTEKNLLNWVTRSGDSCLIWAPVVMMISVIYIIDLIVSCHHTAAPVYNFFIRERLSATSDGVPTGNVILFVAVPFKHISSFADTLMHPQTAPDCSEPRCD